MEAVWGAATVLGAGVSAMELELERAVAVSAVPRGCACAGGCLITAAGPAIILESLVDAAQQSVVKAHARNVSTMAPSPSGDLVATGGCDGDVAVFAVESRGGGRPTARLVWRWEEHDGVVTSLAFSPDERMLVSVGAGDGGLAVWDLATGRQVTRARTLPSPTLAVACAGLWEEVIVSRTGAPTTRRPTCLLHVATAGARGVSQWAVDVMAGAAVSEPVSTHGIARDYLCAEFSPLFAQPWLYVGTASGELTIVHAPSKAVHATVAVAAGAVCSLVVVPGSSEGTISVFHHLARDLEHDAALAAGADGGGSGAAHRGGAPPAGVGSRTSLAGRRGG